MRKTVMLLALLLAALALAWVLIILYAAVSFVRVKRKGRA